jgi:N-methylhydantoinase A
VLQRNGARLGLLVTQGFGDILEIQRLKLTTPVSFVSTRPASLIPRYDVMEVAERVLSDGSIDTPLDVEGVQAAARRLVHEQGVSGIVVSFIHSYRYPEHEQQARRIIEEVVPGVPVTCTHEIWPQIREYERTMAAILTAYVRPNVAQYLEKLERDLVKVGVTVPLHITKSNGGVTTSVNARKATGEILLSGPASGVIGASYICHLAGYDDLITLDMGGTSAEIALVQGGRPHYSISEHVGDFPVIMPAVAVSSIGAGGGSVAWLDSMGVLKVGPRSAGADPGPACYGRGGTEATLSDAFLVCGFLNPDNFVGGRLTLHPDRARTAIAPLAESLGLSIEDAAEAIVEVATSNMYVEFSNVVAQNGLDPRDFSMVPFGGAGAIQACLLAREFHIPRTVVPPSPGTLCALGSMTADVKNDYIRIVHRPLVRTPLADVAAICQELAASAAAWLKSDAPPVQSSAVHFSASLRYNGQAFEIEVPIEDAWLTVPDGLDRLADAFHALHESLYAHSDPQAQVDIIDIRATVVGLMPKPSLRPHPSGSGAPTPRSQRTIRYDRSAHQADIYWRDDVLAGQSFAGPAVVEQSDTTVLIPGGFHATMDALGVLVIERS